mmetsp:Transcript_23354/g.54245  ORF Transcript_23354/g.54245 Transcript_23354/m.54245 type:complete len:223 (-) Transcript_23354:89-757(-)
MASDMCTRRLSRELQALRKDPMKSPRITAVPNEANILEWHYVIEGNVGTPYEGGIYHGKLLFPKEYPLKPPSVMMLTPSGRFQPNRRLCLSMSDFHPESWNPMWSVSTILTGLYSFMVETAPTLGSIETTLSQKRRLAQHSLDYNVRDPLFCRLFPEYVEMHQQRVAERRRRGGVTEENTSTMVSSDIGLAGNQDNGEVRGFLAGAAGVIALLSLIFAFRLF